MSLLWLCMSALVFCSWYSTPYSAYLLYSFSGYHFCGEHFLIYRTAWANATKNSIRIAILLDKIVVVSTRRIIVRSQRYLGKVRSSGTDSKYCLQFGFPGNVRTQASSSVDNQTPPTSCTVCTHKMADCLCSSWWRWVYSVVYVFIHS